MSLYANTLPEESNVTYEKSYSHLVCESLTPVGVPCAESTSSFVDPIVKYVAVDAVDGSNRTRRLWLMLLYADTLPEESNVTYEKSYSHLVSELPVGVP